MDSSWDWIWEFGDHAALVGDAARVRLATLYEDAETIPQDLPDQKLAIYESGRELARQLGERWFEMFYEHWCIEVLLFSKRQPHLALDRAARAVFETSKPEFTGFPQRYDLEMNLASSYAAIDPIGYESELRALLAHIETNSRRSVDDRAYYCQTWGYFLEDIGDAGAIEAGYDYLHAAELTGSDHYISDAMELLCLALVRFDSVAARAQLGDLAMAAELPARREGHHRSVAELLMWQALAARWNGDEREAKRLYRRAMDMQKRIAPPRNSALIGAVAFHVVGEEMEQALRVCQTDIRVLHAHGLTFSLAQRRLKKCRLLNQMGRDFSKDARRLRRAAAKLKSQAHWEMRLEELEGLAKAVD